MPLKTFDKFNVDYIEEGSGDKILLIHSSVSGNRQWLALIEDLKSSFHVFAVNMIGYGATTSWDDSRDQSLTDQAEVALSIFENNGPVNVIGHSIGGAVALKVSELLGPRLKKLILIEPNPFHLLRMYGRVEAYKEALNLRQLVKTYGALDQWEKAAEPFADYWLGENAWNTMPEKRKAAFISALQPNYYEWDAVINETATLEDWTFAQSNVLLLCAAMTRRPILEIADLFSDHCPHWIFREITEGGHMAPLTHPHVINPLITGFLQDSEILYSHTGTS